MRVIVVLKNDVSQDSLKSNATDVCMLSREIFLIDALTASMLTLWANSEQEICLNYKGLIH